MSKQTSAQVVHYLVCAAIRANLALARELPPQCPSVMASARISQLCGELVGLYAADTRGSGSRCVVCGLCHSGVCPSPAELVQRTAAIRAKWSKATERQRRNGSAEGWTPPEVEYEQPELWG